jgi:small nuclear ribonucleoprotein (snRNP)-like protein
MSNNRYTVIFTGHILDGFDEHDVRNNLELIFSGQVEYLFNKAPTHINQNISWDQAQKIVNKLEQLGAKCEISKNLEDEIPLSLESDEPTLSLENADQPDENTLNNSDNDPSDTPSNLSEMICPNCSQDQVESNACINCGTIMEKNQDSQNNTAACELPKKDVLQAYLEEMSKMPTTEKVKEGQGTSFFLKLITAIVLVALLTFLGWSYYFFAYKKPWRESDIASVSIQNFNDQTIEEDQLRVQSKKETILALQKALERKEKLKSTNTLCQSDEQFQLKNIPIPLLRHYIGKYVWVTCDNDSIHQGTLYAIYTEQIVLKKSRFNLTIPINISMIRTVEYDMEENEYDEDMVEAYQAYKRKTEERFQEVPASQIGRYLKKQLRIHLYNGQVYEGILSKCKSKTITLQNIVYGQMVTFVIRKKSIQKIYY